MTYNTPLQISAWHVETDKLRLRKLGKALEELSELSNVLARCIIQGVDEIDPSSGKVNRKRMQDEVADVFTQLAGLIDTFELDHAELIARSKYKKDSMDTWERLIAEEEEDGIGTAVRPQDGWVK